MVSRIDRARTPNQSRGGGVSPARRPAALPPPPPSLRVPVNRARDRFTLPPLLPPPPPLPPSPKAPCRGERRQRHRFTHGGGWPATVSWPAGVAVATKGSSKSGIICFPPHGVIGVVGRAFRRASGERADGLFPSAT